MIDLTRIRTRAGVNPHYVNVDLDFAEVGHLVLSRTGEIGRAEVTADDEGAVDQIARLAGPIANAASRCARPER